ncbi:MAG: hypothetical protein ACUVRU_00910, partial [Anaerolineae bacterium]
GAEHSQRIAQLEGRGAEHSQQVGAHLNALQEALANTQQQIGQDILPLIERLGAKLADAELLQTELIATVTKRLSELE